MLCKLGRTRSWLVALSLSCAFTPSSFAEGDKNAATDATSEKASGLNEAERASKAAEVMHEMMTGEDRGIPSALLEKAQGIAVLPQVIKGAFVVGGKFGKGLVTTRNADGTWSRPIYVELGGVSYGFQAGVEATDLILVFIERDGVESLLDDAVKLGADVSITAGPVGRTAEASTNLTLDSAIYAYSRSKGVFAGASLDGAVLDVDKSANEAVYGPDVDARRILEQIGPIPNAVAPFMKAVKAHTDDDSE